MSIDLTNKLSSKGTILSYALGDLSQSILFKYFWWLMYSKKTVETKQADVWFSTQSSLGLNCVRYTISPKDCS